MSDPQTAEPSAFEQRFKALFKYVKMTPSVRFAFCYGARYALDATDRLGPSPQEISQVLLEIIEFEREKKVYTDVSDI